jgi:flagellar hook assembly protein FlgD
VPDVRTPSPGLALACAPNPSSGAVALRLTLPARARVRAEVFDPAGRRVRVLAADAVLEPGPHALAWDRRASSGAAVPDGLYWVRVRAAGACVVARVVLLH